jgi:hypothetical protein
MQVVEHVPKHSDVCGGVTEEQFLAMLRQCWDIVKGRA